MLLHSCCRSVSPRGNLFLSTFQMLLGSVVKTVRPQESKVTP